MAYRQYHGLAKSILYEAHYWIVTVLVTVGKENLLNAVFTTAKHLLLSQSGNTTLKRNFCELEKLEFGHMEKDIFLTLWTHVLITKEAIAVSHTLTGNLLEPLSDIQVIFNTYYEIKTKISLV